AGAAEATTARWRPYAAAAPEARVQLPIGEETSECDHVRAGGADGIRVCADGQDSTVGLQREPANLGEILEGRGRDAAASESRIRRAVWPQALEQEAPRRRARSAADDDHSVRLQRHCRELPAGEGDDSVVAEGLVELAVGEEPEEVLFGED